MLRTCPLESRGTGQTEGNEAICLKNRARKKEIDAHSFLLDGALVKFVESYRMKPYTVPLRLDSALLMS